MAYAKVERGKVVEVRARPRIKEVSSASLLSDAELKKYGWFPIQDTAATLGWDEVQGPVEYTAQANSVIRNKPAAKRTLSQQKQHMKQKGLAIVEERMQQNHSIQEQIAALANLLSASKKQAVLDDITKYISAYETFVSEVNSASTWAQLQAVYDKYPVLQ